uniref:C-type lectin domain-containing protein n=1 Tax=Oryzias latipes TaxID=8090 RepID=A0A3B3HV40_ORYLA
MKQSFFFLIFVGKCIISHFCLFTCQMYDYYFVNMNLSWTEAQQHCKTHYTDLATVTNRKDLDKLRNMQRSSMAAWIGLYYEAGTNETFHWSLPGVEFNKTNVNWNTNEPNGGKKETCVALCEHFKWVDIDCTTNHYFLCFNNHVILIKENRTWEEALYYCRHHHHDLVTITNMDEQRWVQEKTKNASSPFVWTGLRYTCTLGFWFWVSDEVVHYKNWASPEQMNECDMSGAMQTVGEHKWFKKHDEEKFNFFCSK